VNRRGFVGGLAALGLAGPLAARELVWDSGAPAEAWGVQLYTVRDRMAEDVRGTLEAVAEMGYREVEFAGLFDWTPAEMRALLDDLGLRAASSHHPMQVIRDDWPAALDAAETLGQSLVVLPSLPPDARTPDGLRSLATELNRAGEAARARGLELGFHNHAFEVTPLEDPVRRGSPERPLDILLAGTDPELVGFELDLFWAVEGGTDPEDWFRGHPGRFHAVHVKDRSRSGEMVTVGAGTLDFSHLLQVGQDVGGVRHAFVEHDRPRDSMATLRDAIRYLNSLPG
jgi:sugar phosphate isomerase/epimerase